MKTLFSSNKFEIPKFNKYILSKDEKNSSSIRDRKNISIF